MATWWIDYSAKRLAAATIKATAVGPSGEHPSGVIRYIDAPANLRTKHTDKAEYDDLVRSGLAMQAMYFENGYDDPHGGFAGGQANARRALAGAQWLGFNGVILFCCDRWFNDPAHPPTVTAREWQNYLDGAVSILGRGRTGAYGFADAIDAARGHVDFFVQCGSRSAVRDFVNGWQDNNVQPRVGGISTDRVLILKPFTTAAPSGDGSTPSTATRKVTELMERRTIDVSKNTTAVRLLLSGSDTAAIIIRPRIDGSGVAANPVWLGNIFAWGSNKAGIGHNPKLEPGFDPKVTTHRRYALPGAVWADLEYSSNEPFEIDIVG
ncbi:glycoside hydrolase domain-containing protein [Amycolatopsis vastitatis]|uniref:Rv2525c-like glycoside hydrolase-like domain-containing protein n=1 Tax=Amycolatopsis vastitatis TaxID=1905142 RepID=A0A229TEN0_9PSEU|nr:glycoside hydrolase domain-containing protein [Amycolatopsis vastitatis]OXM69618.1 hypothetical protein CF165_08905 [Amycolatopsis vastitatis]